MAGPVGRVVDGNRLLVIGDSIMASTTQRYGGAMCNRLVPMGWATEIDAESGQHIEFGREVLSERQAAGWDAAVIMLGNNYGGDPQAYADVLTEIVDDLAPRPVVLLTVTEFREDRAEVNFVVRTMAAQRDNVRVVEWAERTRDGRDGGLVSGDGLHLTDAGREELVTMISGALGRAPAGSEGECLPSGFTDDSAGPVDGSSGSSSTGSGSGTGTGGGTGSGGSSGIRVGRRTVRAVGRRRRVHRHAQCPHGRCRHRQRRRRRRRRRRSPHRRQSRRRRPKTWRRRSCRRPPRTHPEPDPAQIDGWPGRLNVVGMDPAP